MPYSINLRIFLFSFFHSVWNCIYSKSSLPCIISLFVPVVAFLVMSINSLSLRIFSSLANTMARRPSSVCLSVRLSVCKLLRKSLLLAGKRRIATKLSQDGLQVSLHPGCAQGQGQGQRSRDTRTFLDSWNELLRHWRSGYHLYTHTWPLNIDSKRKTNLYRTMITIDYAVLKNWSPWYFLSNSKSGGPILPPPVKSSAALHYPMKVECSCSCTTFYSYMYLPK